MAQKYYVYDTTTGRVGLVSGLVSWEQEVPSGTINGANTNFVLTYTPIATKAVFVYLDGILVQQSKYSVNLGTKTVTFNTAPVAGQDVYVSYNK